MSPIAWWAIPALATLAAIVWIRLGGRGGGPVRRRPEPGSAQDRAELLAMKSAMGQPLPGTSAGAVGHADGRGRD